MASHSARRCTRAAASDCWHSAEFAMAAFSTSNACARCSSNARARWSAASMPLAIWFACNRSRRSLARSRVVPDSCARAALRRAVSVPSSPATTFACARKTSMRPSMSRSTDCPDCIALTIP
jgi:hypothetical protein